MATERSEELFREFTGQRRKDVRQQALSQQLGGASEAIVDFFVQKEQRKDEQSKDKLARQQKIEDFTREAELKRELLSIKERNTLLREATRNKREDLRNLELDARRAKEFAAKREKEKVDRADRQKQQKQQVAKAPKISASRFEAATFASRISQAEQVFKNLTAAGFDPTTFGTATERVLPEGFKKQLLKQQEQAERNFVNAVLRRESGAAIAPSEFASAERQYFPRVGDGKKVLEQKRLNRKIVFDGLKAEAEGILPQISTFPKTVKEAQQELEQKVGQIRGQTAPGQSRLSTEKQRRKEELLRKRGVR